ncbi:hypothetical protein niasHT_035378 [Heterodera trifolii]|uniref:Threonine aspartase n=1 Tax=Heterodera trifolii TaxID=157864 RepID=A0ABD2HYU5_9BILA
MFIAVHAGAGFFAESAEKNCSEALKHAVDFNNRPTDNGKQSEMGLGGDGITYSGAAGDCPLVDAVMFLERCPALNCGLGSNLTVAGSVECEAAYMCSRQMAYGAVAIVTNCVNPICAAKALAEPYASSNSCFDSSAAAVGLVQPMVLAGPGANKLCASLGIGTVPSNDQLRTRSAVKEHRRAKQMMELAAPDNGDESAAPAMALGTDSAIRRMDTVGGVAIHPDGMCEACVSSGGILLKREGRMGHSAQFGAAIWAEQCAASSSSAAAANSDFGLSVAISVSGCGEALTRTHFAEALAQQILSMDVDDLAFVQCITHFLNHHFVRSRRLCSFPSDRLLLGGLAVIQQQSRKCPGDESDGNESAKLCHRNRILLLAFHNSAHFPFAFVGSDLKIRRFKSKTTKDGQFVCNLFPT